MQRENQTEDGLTIQDMAALRIEDTPSPTLSSSLSRLSSPSVRITELSDISFNPCPLVEEETNLEDPREEFVSPSKLRLASGVDDLQEVTYLEMRVDTTEQMLGNFGSVLSNLVQLKLNNSNIPSIRDIGTSLTCLRVLWMSRCGLQDVDGVSSLESLEELYLAFNELTDISPLSLLEKLEILDLESNNISDQEQICYLSLCPCLRSLTLEGNPICLTLGDNQTEVNGYREAVKKSVPSLLLLDDEPVVTSLISHDLHTRSSIFESLRTGTEKEWNLVREGIKKRTSDTSSSKSGGFDVERPPSSRSFTPRPHLSDRPATSLGHYSFHSPSPDNPDLMTHDTSSELTHGLNQVMCGNPVRVLRERKRHGLGAQSTLFQTPLPEEPTGELDIIEELKQWRQQYSRMSKSSLRETTANGRSDLTPHSETSNSSPTPSNKKTDKQHDTLISDELVITKTSSITDLDGEEGVEDRVNVSSSEDTLKSRRGRTTERPHPPVMQPHPPPGRRRILPSPPAGKPSHPPRPHTAADFRIRRMRRHSAEISLSDSPDKVAQQIDKPSPVQPTAGHTMEKVQRKSKPVEPMLIASTETKTTRRKLPKTKKPSQSTDAHPT